MSSEKASFAAMASQIWNEKKTIEKKDFNIEFKADNNPSDEKNTTKTDIPKPSFVFGSNLASRCAQADQSKNGAPKTAAEILQSFSKNNTNSFATSSNGASTSTSSAEQCDWKMPKSDESSEKQQTEKPKTGEEDEKNLFQAACKIFQYDAEAKIWRERGPSILRLNENDDFDQNNAARCRLVARSSGTQKLLINSPLFYEMVFEAVSEKRLKISAKAPESELPQLFLLHSSPASTAQLRDLLRQRLKKIETTVNETPLPRKRKAEEEREGEAKKQNGSKSSGGEASGEESSNESVES